MIKEYSVYSINRADALFVDSIYFYALRSFGQCFLLHFLYVYFSGKLNLHALHCNAFVFFTMNIPIKRIDANSFVLFIFEYVRDYVVRYVVGDAQLISRIACEVFSRVVLAIDGRQAK